MLYSIKNANKKSDVEIFSNYFNDNYLVSLYVINILIRNIDIFIMTITFWTIIFLGVAQFIWAKPYKALPKEDRGRAARFPLYRPIFDRIKAVPVEGDQFPRMQSKHPEPGSNIIDKSKLLKCAEARLEEAAGDTGDSNIPVLPPTDAIMNIVKATDFASHKHHFQRRKDPEGTPYIEHPVAVAHILTHLGKISDPVVIISALLHDTVEDTDTTFDEIEKEFGSKVRSVVEELTDNKQMTRDERKRMQILHAAHSSHEAKLVKLADKLHNLRDIERCLPVNWTEERKTQYFNWARDVVRGLQGTNVHIEAELNKMFDKYCTPE